MDSLTIRTPAGIAEIPLHSGNFERVKDFRVVVNGEVKTVMVLDYRGNHELRGLSQTGQTLAVSR